MREATVTRRTATLPVMTNDISRKALADELGIDPAELGMRIGALQDAAFKAGGADAMRGLTERVTQREHAAEYIVTAPLAEALREDHRARGAHR